MDERNSYVEKISHSFPIEKIEFRLALEEFWINVARAFGSSIKRIALEGSIKNDDFRSPSTRLVLGIDPWVNLIENGIR